MLNLLKGTRYALIVDAPYSATDGDCAHSLQTGIGFEAARVIHTPQDGVDPAVLIESVTNAPGYLQSANRKTLVCVASWFGANREWVSPGDTFEGAPPGEIYSVVGATPLKTGVRNWTWIKPLAAVSALVAVGAYVLRKIEAAAERAF